MIYTYQKVIARGSKMPTGRVTTVCDRHCGVEGCRGLVLRVLWNDGKVTYPCTAGMESVNENTLKII